MQRGWLKESECIDELQWGEVKSLLAEGSECQLVCSHRCLKLMLSHHHCSFHSSSPSPTLVARAVQ